jgi:hypothetical protein
LSLSGEATAFFLLLVLRAINNCQLLTARSISYSAP